MRKPKPQGKGIVKALGQKGTTGNFAKIANAKGKGAAIGALQNKLAARRGQAIPFHKKRSVKESAADKKEDMKDMKGMKKKMPKGMMMKKRTKKHKFMTSFADFK